jgi:hypothetical protein
MPFGRFPMNTPARGRGVGVIILLGLCLFAQPSWAAVEDSVRPGPTLEARFILGPNHCPTALGVWVTSTPDTIQGLEIVLQWDRPDFAIFVRSKTPRAKRGTDQARPDSQGVTEGAGNALPRPALERNKGLLKRWEYVEARGETGLWAKVTAVAYLVGESRPRPICPGDTGLLFSLPLELPKSQADFIEGDSAIVRLDEQLTRGSDPKGNTLERLLLRDAVIHTAPCRPALKRRQK